MKFARVMHQGQSTWAIVEGDSAFVLEGGDRFAPNPRKVAPLGPVSGLETLFPLDPTNQVVGLFGGLFKGERDGYF